MDVAGQFSYGLVFNGSSARVTFPDAPSLGLTTAMTLEAWVNPTTVTSSWRDVIFKGNDNYYLMASSVCRAVSRVVGIFAGSTARLSVPRRSRETPGRIWRRPTTAPRSACT